MNREEKMAEDGIGKHEVEEIHKDMHYQLSIELNKWRSHQNQNILPENQRCYGNSPYIQINRQKHWLIFCTIVSDLLHGGGIEDRLKSDTLDLTETIGGNGKSSYPSTLPNFYVPTTPNTGDVKYSQVKTVR